MASDDQDRDSVSEPSHVGVAARNRLDAHFAEWAASLSAAQRRALNAYQNPDRTYERVNGILRGTTSGEGWSPDEVQEVATIIADVRTAIASGFCPRDIVVWRGVRSVERVFGVQPGEARDLEGRQKILSGFTSTTILRQVCLAEFTQPDRGAILRITLSTNVAAAWLPLVGNPALAYQGELLLVEDLELRVVEVRAVGDVLELECEVMP